MNSHGRQLKSALIFSALTLLISGVYAEQDIINGAWDPGFEQGGRWWSRIAREQKKIVYREKPGDKTASIPGVTLGPGQGVDGSGGLTIANSDRPQYFSFVTSRTAFPAEAKKRYVLECQFNGDISSGWAGAEIRFYEKCRMDKGMLKRGKGRPEREMLRSMHIKGSTNGHWQTLRFPFVVPEGVDGIGVTFIAYDFKGKISFDNLRIYPDDGKLYIPRVDMTPEADGFLPDKFMEKAVRLVDFIEVRTGKPAKEPTEVFLGTTSDALHGAICLHHPGRQLPPEPVLERDSHQIFTRESIEFFITQVGGADTPYYQFVMDTAGSLFDGQCSSSEWNGAIRVKTVRPAPDRTVIRFVLPLRELGFSEGDRGLVKFQWKLNFCRNHFDGKKRYSSSWAPISNSFHDTAKFPMLHGDGTKHGQVISGLFLQKAQAENKADDRFWKTDKKLYRELFSSTPNPNGIVSIWSSPLKQENLINALQYGYRYSKDEILAEYEKYHLYPHVWQVPANPSDRIEVAEDWCRKTGLGAMVYFAYWYDSCIALYDDAALDRLFASLERYLTKHQGAVMGVHLGDECFSIYETAFLNRAYSKSPKQRERAASPAFQQALRTIREQYGYGKFGIPSSPTADNEPFNWIAMRKFILARMQQMQKRLFEITRKYRQADGRPLICQTSTGREHMHLLQPERFAPWCDIVALQSNPARTHRHAFMAKFMTDLSLGKPVSAVDHMENLYGSFGPEKTAAGLSQLARGGVTGLIRWGADHIDGKRGKNGSLFCRYGHLPRWNTLNDISLKFHQMPLLKFPKPDYAVLLSQDSFLSLRGNSLPDDEAFFGLAGPAAGSWFKYISDIGLMDGKARLEDWKTVVIVKGNILDPKITAALESYLNHGGRIVCFDPEVASFSPDGNSTREWADRIFGVSRTAAAGVVCYKILPDPKWFPGSSFKNGLPTYGVSKYMLRPESGTEILARFENGQAAATMKVYPNGGRAILCTLPPCFAMSENPEWVRFVLSALRQSGIPVKHDIWNFNFPFEPEKRPVFDSVCLTGNHFYWWRNRPVKEPNVQLKDAFYTLSSAPDHLKDSSHPLKFAFENGNLTNRLSAFEAGDLYNPRNASLVKAGKLKLSQFADTWSDPDSLRIRFQFPKKVDIRRLRLFYQGSLPSFEVKTAAGTANVQERTTDQVLCQEVSLSGGSTDFLEIIFGKNTKPGKLTLSEIEIWGK